MEFDLVIRDHGKGGIDGSVYDIFITHAASTADTGSNTHRLGFSRGKITAANEITSGNESVKGTVSPSVRHCRKEINKSRLALEHHFRNARNRAEVAVNLEGRMRIPKIGKRIVAKNGLIKIKGAVADARSCPSAKTVCRRPTR